MLEFNQPRRFSLPEVQTIFRAIFPDLESPAAYQSEGVFRIPGGYDYIVQITEDILQAKPFRRPEYKVHDYIGALKHALMNCVFNKDDKLILQLKSQLGRSDQTKSIEAIKTFINELVNSEDNTKYAAGEVIYDYLHFLTRAADFTTKNHMDENNLGKMVGALFANLIEEDPHQLLTTITLLNDLCTRFIKEKHFQVPFNEAYRHQFERWRKMHIAELEAHRNNLVELGKDYSARLTVSYDTLVGNQEVLQARNKKLFHSFSKETKQLALEVTNQQQALQRLIDEDNANTLKIKQLDVQIQSLNEEMIPKPGKLLRFSRSAEAQPETEAQAVKPEEDVKKKSVRRKKVM